MDQKNQSRNKRLNHYVHLLLDEIRADWSAYPYLFPIFECQGWHLTPDHYYSPIASDADIVANAGKKIIDDSLINFNKNKQILFLNELNRFQNELKDIPVNSENSTEFCWNNGMFAFQDASLYYAIIRTNAPKRIVEVGSGMSTLIAARAAAINKTTQITAIEPYPVEFFNKYLKDGTLSNVSLIENKIQNVNPALFDELEDGDILFIDNSHVAKIGSDVLWVFFNVLPRLKPGVMVHIHDVFLPYEYPINYYKQHLWTFNEQYLLATFLMNNPDFEVFFGNNYCAHNFQIDYVQSMSQLLTNDGKLIADPSVQVFGSSFWIKRVVKA